MENQNKEEGTSALSEALKVSTALITLKLGGVHQQATDDSPSAPDQSDRIAPSRPTVLSGTHKAERAAELKHLSVERGVVVAQLQHRKADLCCFFQVPSALVLSV